MPRPRAIHRTPDGCPRNLSFRSHDPRTRSGGFSLIELLIVVAIILVIAAIAIPNFIRSKIAANPASVVQSLRTLNSAEVVYSATYAQGYSSNIVSLGPPAPGTLSSATSANLIDSLLASGTKSGYVFVYAATRMPMVTTALTRSTPTQRPWGRRARISISPTLLG